MATVVEVARACNVTPARIHQLVGEGMPREGRGRYSLAACMVWYIKFLQAALEAKLDPARRTDAVAFVRQRTRLAREQTAATRMKTVALRADLVSVDRIEVEFRAAIDAIAAFAKTLPEHVALACEGQTVTERQATLTAAVGELLDFGLAWRPDGER
jgi:phage terminase Nu1 subunit (DNA packaging protein)